MHTSKYYYHAQKANYPAILVNSSSLNKAFDNYQSGISTLNYNGAIIAYDVDTAISFNNAFKDAQTFDDNNAVLPDE